MEVAAVIRITLALLLGSAAAAKLKAPGVFRRALASYAVVPRSLVVPVAAITIVAELGLSVALIAGWHLNAALIGSGVLLAIFAVAILAEQAYGTASECGCLGSLTRIELKPETAAVNFALCAAALWASTQPQASIPLPAGAPGGFALALVAWLLGSLAVMIYWLSAYGSTVRSRWYIANAGGAE